MLCAHHSCQIVFDLPGPMANNSDHWYFSKEKIRNSPSVKDGIDYAKELGYRQQCANLIQDIGQRLQVNQLVINTAIVYMHRFYMFHSFNTFHRNVMASCFLFLAAKVEEQPRKLEHILKGSHVCLHKDEPPLDTKSDEYMQISTELVNNESILLQTLGFEVSVDHPNTFVVKCAQLVKASKELAQTAYFLATNSLHLTTFCIQYKPTLVACVCIYVSCLWANYVIPETGGKNWYEFIDHTCTKKQLEDLSSYFIKILDSCPTRLKKRLTSGGAVVYKEGKVVAKKDSSGSKTNSSSQDSTKTQSLAVNKQHETSKPVSTKNHLTGLLKPHSHEATPPPSSRAHSNHNNHHKKTHHHDLHKKGVAPSASVRTNDHRKVASTSDDKHQQRVKEGSNHPGHHQQKTAEQLKIEQRKKWTPEQWEEYKRRKEKEKMLHYQRKKASESNGKDVKTEKTDFKIPQPRSHKNTNSLPGESPLKRQKLDGDRVKGTLLNEDLSRSSAELHRKHKDRAAQKYNRSLLSSSGSDSDSTHESRSYQNHHLPDPVKLKLNSTETSVAPPPPPSSTGNNLADAKYSSSKLNAPRYGNKQRISPPPPPPPVVSNIF
ncbi:cyclin-T1-like [Hydractinia symbiolongicarpus]|uniref:cyclin-T1-like n=1 Tax=Hydractinia symbiolongicarpus TaxID=13093 RepID=UPI0025501ED6|nr:cyclin-T1-like [Hydractinia symbiolongicarpus]